MERNCSLSSVSTWSQPVHPTTNVHIRRHRGSRELSTKGTTHFPTSHCLPHRKLLSPHLTGKHSSSTRAEATQAFQQLKSSFCTAPTLTHPDLNRRFVVEVDASTLGVGAVLSQWKGEPPVLHPCAYFSKKMSPAEQNYDIGNRKLLAIKLALEEWRHWLEGAQHPFEVITDHKNLQYLREAKRLNPRQARWALFFTRFHFTVTYRPGHKNLKADAISRLHQPDPSVDNPEPFSRQLCLHVLLCGMWMLKSVPPL